MKTAHILPLLALSLLTACVVPTGPVEVTRFNRAAEGVSYGNGSFIVEVAGESASDRALSASPYLAAVAREMQRVGYHRKKRCCCRDTLWRDNDPPGPPFASFSWRRRFYGHLWVGRWPGHRYQSWWWFGNAIADDIGGAHYQTQRPIGDLGRHGGANCQGWLTCRATRHRRIKIGRSLV